MSVSLKQQRISPFIRTTIESAMKIDNLAFSSSCPFKESDRGDSDTMTATMSEANSPKLDESPLMTFVLPLFKCLRWMFFTHSRFEFDTLKGEYHHCSGSLLRKVICLLVQIVTTLFVYMETKCTATFVETSAVTFMYKLMGASYIAYNIAFFHALMTKGFDLVDIFNFVQDTTNVVRNAGCKLPRKRIITWLVTGLLVVCGCHSILYMILNVDGVFGSSITSGTFVNTVADFNAKRFLIAFYSKSVSELESYSFSAQNPRFLVVALAIVSCWLNFMGAITWVSASLLLTLWGLLFWKVLYNFFHLIGKSSVRNTLDDIRRFNVITGLVDRFNHAFAWVILCSVLSGIAHFSVFIVELFKEGQNGWMQVQIGYSFILFGLQLLAASQVNQAATDIVETIKLRYQMEPIWREFHGSCLETTQGLVLILHETQSNKIGFRGFGFFTVTYSFIGTVLSIISTYAVVVLQLQSK